MVRIDCVKGEITSLEALSKDPAAGIQRLLLTTRRRPGELSEDGYY